MQKTLNYNIHSSKKHRQYKSIKVNINTATKHLLCPGNGVCLTLTRPQATQFAHEKCTNICNFVRLCLTTTKTRHEKAQKKHKKIKKT